jgi:uncharacterized membrane protein
MRDDSPMTDDVEPAPDAMDDRGNDDPSVCIACHVLDWADGVIDGTIGTPRHFVVQDERRLVALLRKAEGSVADGVTNFAGSMKFVYLHGIWFGLWVVVNVGLAGLDKEFDKFPFGLLTMIVSLEAIFLATFVMISQNRQAARSDIRSKIDFENNIRSEVWAVHIGQALGIAPEHVEEIVRQTVAAAEQNLLRGT